MRSALNLSKFLNFSYWGCECALLHLQARQVRPALPKNTGFSCGLYILPILLVPHCSYLLTYFARTHLLNGQYWMETEIRQIHIRSPQITEAKYSPAPWSQANTYLCPSERSSVSGSIRSIKMYSCAQCAMQEKSVCCRDVPCLAHMEQGPGPLHLKHLPPFDLPGYWGLSLPIALNKDGPEQRSGHLQAA